MDDQHNGPRNGDRYTGISYALRNPYNLLALAIVVAATAISLNVWPLLVGVPCELIYLLAASRMQQLAAAPAPRIQEAAQLHQGRRTAEFSQGTPAKSAVELRALSDSMPDEFGGDIKRLEAVYRLIVLQLDDKVPANQDIRTQLDGLMERYVYFTDMDDQLCRRLSAAAAGEIRSTDRSSDTVDFNLTSFASDSPSELSFEQRIETWMKQAHEGYEREMRLVAQQRERSLDPAAGVDIERTAQSLLVRNRWVDRAGKSLLNLRYQRQLVEKKFDLTSQELATSRPEQVLSDLRALVLQTRSLTRTLKELESQSDGVESVAA